MGIFFGLWLRVPDWAALLLLSLLCISSDPPHVPPEPVGDLPAGLVDLVNHRRPILRRP